MKIRISFQSLKSHRIGICRRWGCAPMAGFSMKNTRLQTLILLEQIFILMIEKGNVIHVGNGKSFSEDIYPIWFMYIIIFEKIDDGIWVYILLENVLKHFEKRGCLSSCLNFDNRKSILFF